MENNLFMLGAIVTAIVQALSFWAMSWRKGILRAFGRNRLTWDSITFLSITAFVPLLCVICIFMFDESAISDNPEIKAALLISAINVAGLEITKRLGVRVVGKEESKDKHHFD